MCLKKKSLCTIDMLLEKIFCCDVGNNLGFFVAAWDAGGGSDGGTRLFDYWLLQTWEYISE